MTAISFFVPGIPAPQGSKTPWGTEANPRTKPWRAEVVAHAIEAFGDVDPMKGPIHLEVIFVFPRPQSHYRTGKRADELRDDPAIWHSKRPDADKLLRAIGDSLTIAGVWRDDSQVAETFVRKRYVDEREIPGCKIDAYEMEPM